VTDDERIEAALREVGGRLAVPDAPASLATAVLARLEEPAPVSRRLRPGLVPRLVAAVVALLLALGVVMAVSPTVRAAVFDFLRIGGVEIHYEPPPVEPTTDDPAAPGERDVTLDQARAAVPFDVRVPALLGDPDKVRLLSDVDGAPPRAVSLHYSDARVDEFPGRVSPLFEKFTRQPDVVRTDVDGAPAVWIPRPHPVLYVDVHGDIQEEAARLAAKTLIWEANGMTYRVEGDFTQQQAERIARSLR